LKEALDDLRNDPNRRTPTGSDDYAESPGKAQRHFYPNAAELSACLEHWKNNDAVGVVILTGAGRPSRLGLI